MTYDQVITHRCFKPSDRQEADLFWFLALENLQKQQIEERVRSLTLRISEILHRWTLATTDTLQARQVFSGTDSTIPPILKNLADLRTLVVAVLKQQPPIHFQVLLC
jgi:hypothetical protein